MKLYVYEDEISHLDVLYAVFSESKDNAAKLMAEKLTTELGNEFDFNTYMKKCIEQRQRYIELINDSNTAKPFIDAMNEWKTWNKLTDRILSRMIAVEQNTVIGRVNDNR